MTRQNSKTALPGIILVTATILWLAASPAAAREPQDKIQGRYSFRMTPVKSFSADDLANQGGLATAPRQDILRVGVFTADGNGNLSGHTIATTDTNAGATWMITFDWTGKYTLNEDGTGFFSVNAIKNLVCTDMSVEHAGETPHPATTGGAPLAGNVACAGDEEGHEDFAFVLTTRGGKRLELIQTDNAGGGSKIFLTGAATAQESFGRDRDNEGDD